MRTRRWLIPLAFLFAFPGGPSRAQWVQTQGPEGGSPQAFLVSGSSLLVATDGDGVVPGVLRGRKAIMSNKSTVTSATRTMASAKSICINPRLRDLFHC